MKVIRHKIKLFNSNFPKRESHFSVQRERERERERERASLSLLEHSKDVRWDREKEREVENWNTLRGGTAAARRALKVKLRQSLIWSRRRRCQCALGLGTGWGGVCCCCLRPTQSLPLISDPISPLPMARCALLLLLLLSLRRRSWCAWCCWWGFFPLGWDFSFALPFDDFDQSEYTYNVLGVLGLGWLFS